MYKYLTHNYRGTCGGPSLSRYWMKRATANSLLNVNSTEEFLTSIQV